MELTSLQAEKVLQVLKLQACLTLLQPHRVQPTRLHGISQARILKWVAVPFPRGSSPPRDRTQVSCTASRFFITEPLRFYTIASCYSYILYETGFIY